MSDRNAVITALREALTAAPENVALRKHLADLLLADNQNEAAETEYRIVLAHWPENGAVKLALADAFLRQNKEQPALVILERLVKVPEPEAKAFLLIARAYLFAGQTEQAQDAYRQAIGRDATLADPDLAQRLQISDADIAPIAMSATHDAVVERPRLLVEAAPEQVEPEVEKTAVSFKDVGGMEKLKEEIRLKIIHPLQNPEIYQAYGKQTGGGILMYGPPGCGKTHLARATAGEIDATFLAIGLHDVLDMYIGQSEQKLHALFEMARRHAPCVVFIDEVDALGASRNDMRRSAGRQLINQFLAELDGINASNEGVLVLAATNAPWHVDSAFRRPGRFDRIIFVPPPDRVAREAILQIMLQGKPTQKIDLGQLARKSGGYSGADLQGLVDVAVEAKLPEALKNGVPYPIETKDLLTALKTIKPSTRDWFASARNHALYANQSGLYDEVLDYLDSDNDRDLGKRLMFWRNK